MTGINPKLCYYALLPISGHIGITLCVLRVASRYPTHTHHSPYQSSSANSITLINKPTMNIQNAVIFRIL